MSNISKWARIFYNGFLLGGLLLSRGRCTAQTAQVQTKAISEGIAASMTGMRPRPLDMLGRKPTEIKKMPIGVSAPLYGILALGPKEKPTPFLTIMEANTTGEPRVWVDANANGDFTDDPPVKWTKTAYESFDGSPLALYQGIVTVQVRYKSGIVPLRLSLLRYDPKDPNRDLYRNTILYLADYACTADITLGANTYRAMLYDAYVSGDYRGGPDPDASGIGLYIDVNGNGKFDAIGEQFDAWKPFNIKGVTYELANMAPDGSKFEVMRSKSRVPEVLPPPDLSVGKSVLPFTKSRLDGQTAHFPADYKGRLVLLYFWASYCPQCQAEIPYVRDAYRQFHDKGVDILGVSLDPGPDVVKIPIKKYVEDSHMPWPQIYEGKFWQGDLALLYNVTITPTPYLVDGDTGKILALGADLRGALLSETLQKAITAKKAN